MKRFYDFNVWSPRKEVEKLRYMHRNPVARGFGSTPGRLAVEQFPRVCVQRGWTGASQRLVLVGGEDQNKDSLM